MTAHGVPAVFFSSSSSAGGNERPRGWRKGTAVSRSNGEVRPDSGVKVDVARLRGGRLGASDDAGAGTVNSGSVVSAERIEVATASSLGGMPEGEARSEVPTGAVVTEGNAEGVDVFSSVDPAGYASGSSATAAEGTAGSDRGTKGTGAMTGSASLSTTGSGVSSESS
jgi:hypothetical protein